MRRDARRAAGWRTLSSLAAAAAAHLVVALPPSVASSQAAPHSSAASSSAAAGPALVVRDAGPETPGRFLRAALAAPHVAIVRADTNRVDLRRGTTYAATVVVYGRAAAVASHVHGDVVVVGGDLFLEPGAEIDGRAVAIGGGVYSSTLAVVRGGRVAYRDETYVADPAEVVAAAGGAADTVHLDHQSLGHDRPPLIGLPAYGFRFPFYDRVDGLSLAWGPYVALDTGRILVEPTVTYRSQLGTVDPSARVEVPLGRRTTLYATGGRGTLTNDAWIRSDVPNSLSTLAAGTDTRNYYRADRADARLEHRQEGASVDVAPWVGALYERAWSVGPDPFSEGGPYSFFGRHDRTNGMLRPNPPVLPASIASVLAGATAHWQGQGNVAVNASARVERPLAAPAAVGRFTQGTFDASVGFPTFGVQRLDVAGHAVVTVGDTPPPQRFAYLGGSSTIVTSDLLSLGGDELLYLEGTYTLPLDRPRIPFIGSPTIALRHMIGSAGVGRLPTFVQNVGVRVSLNPLRLDYAVDPATRHARFGVSLSLFR